MTSITITGREHAWERAGYCRDAAGQAHFPNDKLGAGEVSANNPWTLNGKKIPRKPIKMLNGEKSYI